MTLLTSENATNSRPTGGERIEILLVDDRPENLLALEAVLAEPAYDLMKAGSGQEALRYLLDHNPAVILLDVQMPGMDGYETAGLIKGSPRTRDIPIIFVTALNEDERYSRRGYEHGAVDYIYKPFDTYVLRSKVAVLVEMKRQRDRIRKMVAVQETATRALADTSDIGAAITRVLGSICTTLDWELGLFWEFDKRSNTLRCRSEWHQGGAPVSELLAATFGESFFPGMGFPGRVWASGRVQWLPDFSREQGFARSPLAARAGLHAAIGVPLAVRDETLGVLEFFAKGALPEDSEVLKVVGAIGSQVGQALSRAQAMELLAAGEARKSAILETALDCIVSVDQQGRILEFNPAAERTFGRSFGEVSGRSFAETIFPLAQRDELSGFLAGCGGARFEDRTESFGLRADGDVFPMELAVVRTEVGGQRQFTFFLRDITERRRYERDAQCLAEAGEALSLSLDRTEMLKTLAAFIVSSIADWCLIDLVDADGGYETPAAAHIDPGREELVARLGTEFKPDSEARAGAPAVIRSGDSELHVQSGADALGRLAAGRGYLELLESLGCASSVVVPLRVRNQVLGAITLVRGPSSAPYRREELLLAEEVARRAAMALENTLLYEGARNAISMRDEFFSIASHELKTPITSLKMQIDMILRVSGMNGGRELPRERLLKMLVTSSRQVDRLTHLVEELLDVVKIRAGKLTLSPADVKLDELVREVTESFTDTLNSAGCKLELAVDSDVHGYWDRSRIEQIVVNLVGNAIKYAPGKPIRVEVGQHDGMASLMVRDWGPGIPAERQARIFERFERAVSSRNVSGLGLGLFIARQIVQAHGGSIDVESREGEGSTFRVRLPLAPSAAQTQAQAVG